MHIAAFLCDFFHYSCPLIISFFLIISIQQIQSSCNDVWVHFNENTILSHLTLHFIYYSTSSVFLGQNVCFPRPPNQNMNFTISFDICETAHHPSEVGVYISACNRILLIPATRVQLCQQHVFSCWMNLQTNFQSK